MSSEPPAWKAWDVPFFGTSVAPRVQPRTPEVLPLAGDGSRAADRVWAVLMAAGGFVAGAVFVGGFFVLSFVLSFGSEPSALEKTIVSGVGLGIAIGGLILAVLAYRHAGVASDLRVAADHVSIGYRAFRERILIPRERVRLVAIDDAPVILFTKNERFAIRGRLPEHAFADALDNVPRLPWEDLNPDVQLGPIASAVPAGPTPPYRQGHLWSGDGSSLPFLRLGPGDVPNVAIIFEGRVATPRAPWWLPFTASSKRAPLFTGGRKIGGVLLRLRDARGASEAFGDWGVVRDVEAEDVLDQRLLVAKPLRGWRIVAYAAILVVPLVLQVLLRR